MKIGSNTSVIGVKTIKLDGHEIHHLVSASGPTGRCIIIKIVLDAKK